MFTEPAKDSPHRKYLGSQPGAGKAPMKASGFTRPYNLSVWPPGS